VEPAINFAGREGTQFFLIAFGSVLAEKLGHSDLVLDVMVGDTSP
jgi:hypothetical protein